MSTISTNPPLGLAEPAKPHPAPQAGSPSSPLQYTALPASPSARLETEEPTYGGLTPSAWLKIGIVGLLMAVLFRFNLSRLWLKTNPFNGQPNWGHAFFVPLIGLYFLYVNRRDLIKPPPPAPVRGSLVMAWGLFTAVWVAALALAFAAIPGGATAVGLAAESMGLLKTFHDWPLGPAYLTVIGSAALAVWLFWSGRQIDRGRRVSQRAAQLWPHLLTWAMVVATLWGVGFFVGVVWSSGLLIVKIVLSALGLLSLGALVFGEGSEVALSWDRAAQWLAERSPIWFGGFLLAWGILFSFWGIWPGKNDFFKDVGMVVAVFGVVLLLGGWGVMRTAWFPVLFLFCALPWPDQVYSWLAGPLQHMAASVATKVLTIFNVPSQVAGTKIIMDDQPGAPRRILNVAEACAGLRSLMTFVSLAAGWAFLFLASRPLWHRLVLAACAVPIAIACNVMRVSGQGLLDHFVSRQLSDGFAHQFAGLVMLIPAFFMILLVGWILDHLFIEEADGSLAAAAGAAASATSVTLAGGANSPAANAPTGAPIEPASRANKAASKAAGANAGKVLVVPRPGAAQSVARSAAGVPVSKPQAIRGPSSAAAPPDAAGSAPAPAPGELRAPRQAARPASKPASQPQATAPPASPSRVRPAVRPAGAVGATGSVKPAGAAPAAPAPSPAVRRPQVGSNPSPTGQSPVTRQPAAKAPTQGPPNPPNALRALQNPPQNAQKATRGSATPGAPGTPGSPDTTETTETTEGL